MSINENLEPLGLVQDKKQRKWDNRFLRLAEHISLWSLDPSTKCGAVIIDPRKRIISLGYNGLPQGVADTPERLNVREMKYKVIVHCERNAIIFAQRDLTGCTLYTWPFMSCSVCAAMVIQSGISRVVAPQSDNPRWVDDFIISSELFAEAGVQVDLLALDSVL
jgi:dCMP deaminase